MICQWQDLLSILPVRLRADVDKQGKEDMQEIRMRLHKPPEIVKRNHSVLLKTEIIKDDLSYCLNAATRYSPWISSTVRDGFVTALGGHRIGICGECVYDNNMLKTISSATSLCIRVARDYSNVSKDVYREKGSILIIGMPGSGKTTFLRDLIRKISDNCSGAVVVIDERREIFPYDSNGFSFPCGQHTDVLTGCEKRSGLEMAIRTMSPSVVALDEITGKDDCSALLNAAWCGVRLIATAHAGSQRDLFKRKIYEPILQSKIFDTLIILQSDKSWIMEDMRCY